MKILIMSSRDPRKGSGIRCKEGRLIQGIGQAHIIAWSSKSDLPIFHYKTYPSDKVPAAATTHHAN